MTPRAVFGVRVLHGNVVKLIDDVLQHSGGRQVLLILAEHSILNWLAGAIGLLLGQRVQLVQTLDEQQVGQLRDHGQWVGNASGPHRVPDAVNPALEIAGNHRAVIRSVVVREGGGGSWKPVKTERCYTRSGCARPGGGPKCAPVHKSSLLLAI